MNKEYNYDPYTGEKIVKDNTSPAEQTVSDDTVQETEAVSAQPEQQDNTPQTTIQPDTINTESVTQPINMPHENPLQNIQPITAEKSQNKTVIIILAVISTVVLLAAAIAAGYFLISGYNQVQKPENPILAAEAIKMSSVKLEDGMIPGIYAHNMPAVEIKGVGTKSSVIDTLRQNTDKNLNAFHVSEITDGIKCYSMENEIVRIDIPADTNGFKYNRIYYFNNNVLYFAFIYSPSHQNSLYFHNGELYKYINEKGETKQNDFKNDVFKTLGNFAVNEAYAFYDYKAGEKSVR